MRNAMLNFQRKQKNGRGAPRESSRKRPLLVSFTEEARQAIVEVLSLDIRDVRHGRGGVSSEPYNLKLDGMSLYFTTTENAHVVDTIDLIG